MTILPVPAEAPTRRGQRWTPEESESVRAAFMAQTPIEVIAARYQRTPFAIAIHLVRYGLLREEEALVYKVGMETDKSSVDAHEKEPLVALAPHKRQRKGEKWSCSEENLVLHRWRKEGKTLESIATEHGRTPLGLVPNLGGYLASGARRCAQKTMFVSASLSASRLPRSTRKQKILAPVPIRTWAPNGS